MNYYQAKQTPWSQKSSEVQRVSSFNSLGLCNCLLSFSRWKKAHIAYRSAASGFILDPKMQVLHNFINLVSVVRFGCSGARKSCCFFLNLQMIISASQFTSLLFFAADISVLLQEGTTHPWLLSSGSLQCKT